MALQGAEVLLYPTAIGSEPHAPINSYMHWLRVQQGHAAANVMPLVASNRVGEEHLPGPGAGAPPNAYYGGSFIAGSQGEVMAQVGAKQLEHGHPDADPALVEGFVTATVDLDKVAVERAAWGVFRDRRPELYGCLATLGGSKA
ncbi:N-carbamoylputrescine amidase [Tetrabaena socialis]|uniref:N-carbamoylputrescine amidase n=1 Tax=Tetrabaena socialis TaxID=47790 RepID=A0A2J7ZYS0_9CHLO|nr:N-carbamoylputrescine amidase [Tetrabaena socialis]|eukprot:PNH05396.1 N-carbamoylputrescine amidase [Tetrabaena socialis]